MIQKINYKVNRKKTMKLMIERYNSANEVVEDLKRRPEREGGWDSRKEKVSDDPKWYGVKTYDEALELLRTGYQPTVDKLKSKMKSNLAGSGKRISFKNNIVGANAIVPLALMGVPNCMQDMQMKPIKNKVIDVYYDMTAHCGITSDQIIEQGQKVLGAILELEAQGYRFNLYAVQGYANEKSADMLVIKLKSANQPLDLKRISFPLTHTAFFRVIGFDWYHKCPESTYRWGYGHNITKEIDSVQDFAKNVFGKNAVMFTCASILSEDEQHLKEVIENAGNNNKQAS